MKKKKHYYNKNKFEIKIPKNATVIDIMRCIRPDSDIKEKLWLDFANDIILKKKKIFLPEYENLAIILGLIHSKQTLGMIIRYLYSIENYNPFTDIIPLYEETPEDVFNIIVKKQNYIKKYLFYKSKHNGVLTLFNTKYNPVYLDNYEVVIGLSDEYVYIYSKDLNYILKKLNNIEPDVWTIQNNYIINWNKKTKLNFFNKKISNILKKGE